MRTVELYRTRDGKEHRHYQAAQDHICANAETELRYLLDETVPGVPENHRIAQAIILRCLKDKKAIQRLKAVVQWLEDLSANND